jgi:hypothetical protein
MGAFPKATLIVANAIVVVNQSFMIVSGSTNSFYSHIFMNWG